MAWKNPVTTWGQAGKTVPVAGDFNRIEGNTQYLKDEVDSHKAENASTTAKGHVQLSSSTSSTSTSLAATASAVKTVKDEVQAELNTHKADNTAHVPQAHASSDTTYGVGTTANYGHCKTINNLTQSSHVDGTALSAYQGYVLSNVRLAGKTLWVGAEGSRGTDANTIYFCY